MWTRNPFNKGKGPGRGCCSNELPPRNIHADEVVFTFIDGILPVAQSSIVVPLPAGLIPLAVVDFEVWATDTTGRTYRYVPVVLTAAGFVIDVDLNAPPEKMGIPFAIRVIQKVVK